MAIELDGGSSNVLASNSTAVTTPEITTTVDDVLLVSFFFGADNTSVSAFNADSSPNVSSGTTVSVVNDPPVDKWFEVADSNTTLGADTTSAFAHAVKSSAGATGTLRCTAGNSSKHGLIVGAFRFIPPAPSGPPTITGLIASMLTPSGGRWTVTAA